MQLFLYTFILLEKTIYYWTKGEKMFRSSNMLRMAIEVVTSFSCKLAENL